MSHAKPLDLKFSYSGAEAYVLIEGYEESVRNQYANGLLYLDFVYPLIYSLLFAFLLYLPSFSIG